MGGTDTPYSAYGRYYIRVNDSDIVMHSSQLEHFSNLRKIHILSGKKKILNME